jgi:Uma2 family endonuclease
MSLSISNETSIMADLMNQTDPAILNYPESDGKPMAESALNRDWMVRIIELLQCFFKGVRVYVSGNLLIYYVEGDPTKSVAPDVFVVKDCDPKQRRVFKIWEERRTPSFALEITSPKTRREDQVHKMRLYAQLGIEEYFLYDPLAEWLEPALFGYRLVGGGYVPIEPDTDTEIISEQLGITFRLEKGRLALFATSTGQRLTTGNERAAEAEARAEQEAARAEQAEARAQALEQELARLRAERLQ